MACTVALARAIAVEPEVLLYDEPTTGLDQISIRRLMALIRNLQERLNVTSMVVTHEMPSVFTITNRIAMPTTNISPLSEPQNKPKPSQNLGSQTSSSVVKVFYMTVIKPVDFFVHFAALAHTQ